MATIDHKFKGIEIISSSQSRSKITIRNTYIPFITSPIAVQNCGACGEITKHKLLYLRASHFVEENCELKCDNCKAIDYISYEKA